MGGGKRAEGDPGVELTPQIYLNDSFEVADVLARAQTLSASGRWEKAARLLQETSDRSGDALVRVSPGHYIGVRRYVQDLIAHWPKEGLSAYRALFEREITEAMAHQPHPRSAVRLLSLFNRYFCTASAATLADAIGQLAIEGGDLALARRVYRRVIEGHPDASLHKARYRLMLALVRAMSGEDVDVDSADLTDATIRWQGEDRTVRDVLDGLPDSFVVLESSAKRSAWPLVGGEAARNRLGTTHVDELGLLWRFDGFGRRGAGTASDDRGDEVDDRRTRPRTLTIYPVADKDLIYVQHDREVVALHRNTGVVAWRFCSDDASPGAFADFDEQPSTWNAPTVQDGRLFVALPGDVVPFFDNESAQSPPELVCLDARTGRVIWPEDRELYSRTLPEIAFDTSPIVEGGHVYVVGRRRRSFGFEDCYLLRFAEADGALEFKTHLGSASSGSFGSPRPTMAVAALKGDTVYVCTNLGSIAALSAHTGTVRWLRLYNRDRDAARRETTWSVRDVNPWAFNPVIVTDGAVIANPTDAARVFALDVEDGHTLWSVPTAEMGQVEMVLGMHEHLLCGAGSEAACYDVTTGSLRWSTPFPEGATILGRGAWVDDRLLVATSSHLCSFAIADGQRTDLPWNSTGGGGNLLPLPDELVVAGADSIAAYVRKSDIWNSLRRRMTAEPTDPTPALEFAEVALRGGEYTKAVEVLDEAVRRMDGFTDDGRETLRRRFFSDLLMFADTLGAQSLLDPPTMEKLFSYAARYPTDEAAHLTLRLRFAKLFAAHDRPKRAVELYQQILSDRSLRDLAVTGAPSHTGAERAQHGIGELMERFGASVYAPFEAEARRSLELAKAGRDEALLDRLVEVYPNSDTAVGALIAHGDLLSASGHSAEAAALWARAYYRYPKKVNRPALIRKIADAHERAGRLAHAYRWLTKGTREHPDVLLDYQGGLVTFAAYRKRLADVRDTIAPSRPAIALPLKGSYERTFDASVRLLVPLVTNDPAGYWGRYHVQTPTGVRAFDTRTNRELWDHEVATHGEAELLLATENLSILATANTLFGVDASTGLLRWSFGEIIEGFGDELADWEEGKSFRAHAVSGTRLLSVRVNGELTCIDLATGALIWSVTPEPPPGATVRFGDPWVGYHTMKDGRVELHLIAAANGAAVRTIETDETRPVEALFVALDGQVILVTSQSIASYDGDSGTLRWQIVLAGHLQASSLLLDLDALYFSEGDGRLRKISLENGGTLWRSEPLVAESDTDLSVHRQGDQLIVTTVTSVSGIDDATGVIRWRGSTPEPARFLYRFITQSFVAAVDIPDEPRDADSTVYFYDHREGSGVIPRAGGTRNLGRLTDLKAILAVDGAIIAQTGSTIRAWTELASHVGP